MNKHTLSTLECDRLYKICLELMTKIECIRDTYPVFYNNIKLMTNNLGICIDADYDSIDELTDYLKEDWTSIFRREKKMENLYISAMDIDKNADINMNIQKLLLQIDEILKTDLQDVKLIAMRKWYTKKELSLIAEKYESIRPYWEAQIKAIEAVGFRKSSIEGVGDDVWTYAGCLITTDEEHLKQWFSKEIPAYSYLSPLEIIRLDNGDKILKDFLLSIHTQ